MDIERYLLDLSGTDSSVKRTAYFDLDRTLIKGYSLTALAWQQFFNLEMSPRRFVTLGWMFIRYGLGHIQYEDMLGATIKDITGMPEEELTKLAQQAYDNRLKKSIYLEGAQIIQTHRALGHEVVMVTSATKYQAEPIAEKLGIEKIYCTEVEIVDARVAGGVAACYGKGKLVAANQHASATSTQLSDAFFYSDSLDDLPLLEAVGRPVVVNGRPKLVQLGQDNGWPILNLDSRAMYV